MTVYDNLFEKVSREMSEAGENLEQAIQRYVETGVDRNVAWFTPEVVSARDIFDRVQRRFWRVGGRYERAQKVGSMSDVELRIENNPRDLFWYPCRTSRFDLAYHCNHQPDPVSGMLYEIQAVFDPCDYDRNDGRIGRLVKHAHELSEQISKRTMTEATYNALTDGTHPIYQQSGALGLDIEPWIIDERRECGNNCYKPIWVNRGLWQEKKLIGWFQR